MTWLNSSIPVWQLLSLVTAYVLYRELIKFGFKRVMKLLRRKPVTPPEAISTADVDIPRQ